MKNAAAFRMLTDIVRACPDPLIIVVSAMGKATNRFEEIVRLAWRGSEEYVAGIEALKQYHLEVVRQLIPDGEDRIYQTLEELFEIVGARVTSFRDKDFNLFYDQVVSLGEVISTRIVSRYLSLNGLENNWVDIRECLVTDENFRDASIDFDASEKRLKGRMDFQDCSRYICQGFIGGSGSGLTTTLGREGSDFTAAVLGHVFHASSVTLWKDVEGIFNADPAVFREVTLLEQISYQEMIELAYYGAKVIHPKTIKPLRQKQIPLLVKSFFHPGNMGTSIGEYSSISRKVPITILKEKQILISISLQDLSIISESHISKLFGLLYRFRLKANLLQHSAVSFSVCVDEPRGREVEDVIGILKMEFKVLYNDALTLITIRNYTEDSIREMTKGKRIYVEQRSRSTVQYITS